MADWRNKSGLILNSSAADPPPAQHRQPQIQGQTQPSLFHGSSFVSSPAIRWRRSLANRDPAARATAIRHRPSTFQPQPFSATLPAVSPSTKRASIVTRRGGSPGCCMRQAIMRAASAPSSSSGIAAVVSFGSGSPGISTPSNPVTLVVRHAQTVLGLDAADHGRGHVIVVGGNGRKPVCRRLSLPVVHQCAHQRHGCVRIHRELPQPHVLMAS